MRHTYFTLITVGGFSHFTATACCYCSAFRSPRIRCLKGRLATSWKTLIPSKVLSSSRHTNWVDLRLSRRATGVYTPDYMPARDARVDLVHLVSLVQPNKPDKPNKQERPVGSRASRATV